MQVKVFASTGSPRDWNVYECICGCMIRTHHFANLAFVSFMFMRLSKTTAMLSLIILEQACALGGEDRVRAGIFFNRI